MPGPRGAILTPLISLIILLVVAVRHADSVVLRYTGYIVLIISGRRDEKLMKSLTIILYFIYFMTEPNIIVTCKGGLFSKYILAFVVASF